MQSNLDRNQKRKTCLKNNSLKNKNYGVAKNCVLLFKINFVMQHPLTE